jgi:hypothetical protein
LDGDRVPAALWLLLDRRLTNRGSSYEQTYEFQHRFKP